jgi:glycosyltransferase involved in cell wall biosynthesis
MGDSLEGKTTILFVAWGFSIHAKRRIQIFIDDPRFSVIVASTYNYNFDNAVNILLSASHTQSMNLQLTTEPEIQLLLELIESLKITDQAQILYAADIAIGDFLLLQETVERFKPDVIFLQTLLYPCYLAFFLPHSIPLIITFWNGDVVWRAQWDGIDQLFKNLIVTYGIRRADGITVNSTTAFDGCIKYGAEKGKVQLIRYPGVDLERFHPQDKYLSRKNLGINTKYLVLCPRGLGGYLNSDVIIEAAGIVCEKYSDTTFLFISKVGAEEWEKHYKRACELGIEQNVRHDGQISWESMPVYYSCSDVMVSISSNDSLPNCMLEAMACGIPIIMGDIPQIKEWITDSYNGFLVPPKDYQMLANKISDVFENGNNIINNFRDINIKLIDQKVNSKINIEIIKNFVLHAVDKTTPRHFRSQDFIESLISQALEFLTQPNNREYALEIFKQLYRYAERLQVLGKNQEASLIYQHLDRINLSEHNYP